MLKITYKDGTSDAFEDFGSFDTLNNLFLVYNKSGVLLGIVNLLDIKVAKVLYEDGEVATPINHVFKKACAPGSILPDDIVSNLPDDIVINRKSDVMYGAKR